MKKSHEILKEAFEKSSPKEISSELGVSLSLVYKWAQEQNEAGSGSRNPLARLIEIIRLTGDIRLLEWLCQIVAQFSGVLQRIAKAAEDNSITADEAEEIRQLWDRLKCYGEGFVRCCEEVNFEQMNESHRE